MGHPSRRHAGTIGLMAFALAVSFAPLSADEPPPVWGLDDPRVTQSLEPLREFQTRTGLVPTLVAWRESFSRPFPAERCGRLWKDHSLPLILMDVPPSERGETSVLEGVVRGRYDHPLRAWADAAARYREPVLIHFLRQFNQNTHPWSIAANDKNASLVPQAFEHVVKLFRDRHADNVRWVWGPNVFPLPAAGWNDWTKAYPGDAYVDFVALEGLDFGNSGTIALPMSFEQLFASPLRTLRGIAPRKPVILASVATARTAEEREWWLGDMATALMERFPMVRGVVWYNQSDKVNWMARERDAKSLRKLVSRAGPESARGFFLDHRSWSARDERVPAKPVWKIPFVAETELEKVPAALEESPRLDLSATEETLVGRPLEVEKQLGAHFRFGWNHYGLIVWCEVEDRTLGDARPEPARIWDGDSLEIGIGPVRLPKSEPDLAECFRILVSPGGASQMKPVVALVGGRDGMLRQNLGGIAFESQFGISGRSYRLFGVIPWRSVGIEPTADSDVTFNVCVTDGFGGHRIRQLIWSGGPHYYHDAAEWGTLRLRAP